MSLINIEKTITLDVYDYDTTPSVIKTIQMDTGTRTVFAVIQNSRQDYDIGQNATVSLTVLRPDKTKVQVTGQTFVCYTGTDGTMYGAKAELSDVALAVKGNLKAQFKITSGEQELRTEIFTISNGEALDADDGDWAGDLDGHNLDEMAQDIEDAKTAVAEMESDVSELKSGFNDMIPVSWADGDGIATASTITIGKYRNLERNTLTTDAKCAVSSALYASNRKAVTFTDTNYEFAVIAYNNSPVSSANMIGGYGWYPANTIVILPPEAFIFVYQVRKASAIDSSEEEAIKNGLKTYVPTDSTLSVSGKSADAKATGDALDALRLIPARSVLAIGDSICRGERNDGKGFVGDLGLEYVNAGVSGATISTIRDTTTHWIENQLTAQTDDFDVVIMQGGINDYIYDATLGTMSAVPVRKEDSAFSSLDTTTVIGALEHLFATCINKYPNADRFFLISHKTREYAWTAGDGGWTQDQLHDAIVACCRLYNVGVIDVYAESPINTHYTEYVSPTEWNNDHSVGNTEWVDNDRVHPLEYGYLHGYLPLIRKALIATSSKE